MDENLTKAARSFVINLLLGTVSTSISAKGDSSITRILIVAADNYISATYAKSDECHPGSRWTIYPIPTVSNSIL